MNFNICKFQISLLAFWLVAAAQPVAQHVLCRRSWAVVGWCRRQLFENTFSIFVALACSECGLIERKCSLGVKIIPGNGFYVQISWRAWKTWSLHVGFETHQKRLFFSIFISKFKFSCLDCGLVERKCSLCVKNIIGNGFRVQISSRA